MIEGNHKKHKIILTENNSFLNHDSKQINTNKNKSWERKIVIMKNKNNSSAPLCPD